MLNHYSLHCGNATKQVLKLAAILILFMAPMLLSAGALAASTDPDSTPTASNIHINRNLIVTGDELIYGLVNIPYANPPTATVDTTFIMRVMDSTKTTQYGYNYLYPYFTKGYNVNLFGLYFTPAAAPTWNTELTLRISESPSYFSNPVNMDVDIPVGDYTTLTATADNQTELAQKILPIVNNIGTTNGNVALTASSGQLTVLTGMGELVVGGAIYGIQMMAPSLFLVQNLNLDYTNATWQTTQFDSYTTQWAGTWVGDDMTATGDQFGMPPTMVMSFFVSLPLMLGLIVASSWKLKHTDPGLMCCGLILLMTVQMGWMPKAVFASIYQICGIYVAYLWFFARS